MKILLSNIEKYKNTSGQYSALILCPAEIRFLRSVLDEYLLFNRDNYHKTKLAKQLTFELSKIYPSEGVYYSGYELVDKLAF